MEKEIQNSTFSTLSSNTLSSENLLKGIEAIKKASENHVHIVKGLVKSNDELSEFEKLNMARDLGFSNIYGIPIYDDASVPENTLRLIDCKGKITDVQIRVNSLK